MLKKVFFWIALSWTSIIAFLCLIPANDIPSVSIPNLDKGIHATFHFVFTLLWFLFFKKQMSRSNSLKPLIIAFVLSIFYGIGIEIMQGLFTKTRQADVMDVLANVTGATLAVIVILLFDKNKGLDQI